MNLEINIYLKDSPVDFKSKELNNSLKLISKKVISQNLSKNENFKCYLTKSGKQKVLVRQT